MSKIDRYKFEDWVRGDVAKSLDADWLLFVALCEEVGARPRRCAKFHFQAVGKLRVNYWPTSGYMHANGTVGGQPANMRAAVEASMRPPSPVDGVACRRLPKRWRRRTRAKLAELHGTACHWCGKELSKFRATIEHLIPRSRGGSDQLDNLRLACRKCNQDRGAEMPEMETE